MEKERSYQWRILLLTMLCYLFFYTGRHNFGWAARLMSDDLSIPYERIGWISFSMLMGYAIGQLVNGNLADRLSARHLIVIGGLLSVASNICISFASSFEWIVCLWALNGYFQSMAWAPGSRILANWWPRKDHGMVFGMYTMAAASSSIVTYFLSIVLVSQNDWRLLFRLPVLLLLAVLIIYYFFSVNKPSDKGLKIDGVSVELIEKQKKWWTNYRIVFSSGPFLLACLSIGFQSMARYGLIFWLPVYLLGESYRTQPHQIWVSLLLPVGMALGALSFGFIADRLFNGNRVKTICLGLLGCSLVCVLIYLVPVRETGAIAVLFLLVGFLVYGPQSNFWALCPVLVGHQRVGTGIGVMNMTAYVFAALGEPIIGKTMDYFENSATLFLIISGIALASALIILTVKTAPR